MVVAFLWVLCCCRRWWLVVGSPRSRHTRLVLADTVKSPPTAALSPSCFRCVRSSNKGKPSPSALPWGIVVPIHLFPSSRRPHCCARAAFVLFFGDTACCGCNLRTPTSCLLLAIAVPTAVCKSMTVHLTPLPLGTLFSCFLEQDVIVLPFPQQVPEQGAGTTATAVPLDG